MLKSRFGSKWRIISVFFTLCLSLIATVLLVAIGSGAFKFGDQVLAQQSGSATADRAALVALYDATGGANWTTKTNWKTTADLGTWHGVTTDSNGRVTRVDLEENNLIGTIPSSIGTLSELTHLNLHWNDLSGDIPSSIGNLSELTHLSLYGNRLSGSLPSSLGNLSNLAILYLHANSFSGSIPSQLANLSNLEQLRLDHNRFDGGSIPSWITSTNFPELDNLNLSSTNRTGAIPSAISGFNKLKALSLGFNDFNSGSIPSWITSTNFPDLINLNLSSTNRTGAIPSAIGAFSKLKGLSLAYNGLSGSLPDELGDLSNLEYLDLRNNGISGEIPEELGDLSKLKVLQLGNNQLSGAVPAKLGDLSALVEMRLYWNQLSGSIPTELGNLSNLVILDFNGNSTVSGSIPTELGGLSQLQHLILNGNQLTGSIPSELGNLSNLTELWLDGNDLTGGIPSELGDLSKLEDLRLSSNEFDSGPVPSWITATKFPNMRILDLEDMNRTGSIPSALGNLSNLTYLDLSRNQFTSGAVPSWITSTNFPNLTVLELESANRTGSIPTAIGGFRKLQRLNLCDNDFDSGQIPSWLNSANFPDLELLRLCETNRTGSIPAWLGNFSNLESLNLASNTLTGSIPSNLRNLSKLRTLSLYSNSLSGSIPSWLGNLSDLGYLRLHYNSFSGSIPSELGNLTGLHDLSLSNNVLTGTIPASLGNLPWLSTLRLERNSLSGSIPTSFGQTIGVSGASAPMEYFYVNRNQLSGPIPDGLGNFENLRGIDLSQNDFDSGPVPSWISNSNFPNLVRLRLVDTNRTGTIPSAIGNMSGLLELDLSWNPFDEGSIPSWLTNTNLPELEVLDLRGTNRTGEIPSALGSMSNLSWLGLCCADITGSIPSELGNLSNLQGLLLHHTSVSGSIPSSLGNLSKLNSLWLSSNSLTGSIPSELGNLSNLRALSVKDNSLTGSIPSELGNLSNLGHLHISENSLTGTLPSELGDLSNLLRLHVDDNSLTGNVPSEFGNLSNLKRLVISKNRLSGVLPEELSDLDDVKMFHFHFNSDLCAPATNSFQTWIDSVENVAGDKCGLDLTISTNPISVNETDGETTISITARLRHSIGQVVDVILNLGGTADQNSDYTIVETPEPLRLPAAGNPAASTSFKINPNTDSNYEHEEYIALFPTLTVPAGVALTPTIEPAAVFILDEWTPTPTPTPTNTPTPTPTPSAPTPTPIPPTATATLTPAQYGDPNDRETLKRFYNQANGENWTRSKKRDWLNDNVALTDWYGVATHDETGKVTYLGLYDANVTGDLSELNNLTDLKRLNLSGNNINSFPNLGNLRKLQRLDLSENEIGGAVPSWIYYLSALKELDLSYNKFAGIPSEMGYLPNLEELYINNNDLISQVWGDFEYLDNLRTFRWGPQTRDDERQQEYCADLIDTFKYKPWAFYTNKDTQPGCPPGWADPSYGGRPSDTPPAGPPPTPFPAVTPSDPDDTLQYIWFVRDIPSQVSLEQEFEFEIEVRGLNSVVSGHGGISVSFPGLTSADADLENDRVYDGAAAEIELLTPASGTNVKFFEPQNTDSDNWIYKNSVKQRPGHLLVEMDNAGWGTSDSRTLKLRVTPKQSGSFKIRMRAWICRDGYNDCSRKPTTGSQLDQQGYRVDERSVTVSSQSTHPNTSCSARVLPGRVIGTKEHGKFVELKSSFVNAPKDDNYYVRYTVISDTRGELIKTTDKDFRDDSRVKEGVNKGATIDDTYETLHFDLPGTYDLKCELMREKGRFEFWIRDDYKVVTSKEDKDAFTIQNPTSEPKSGWLKSCGMDSDGTLRAEIGRTRFLLHPLTIYGGSLYFPNVKIPNLGGLGNAPIGGYWVVFDVYSDGNILHDRIISNEIERRQVTSYEEKSNPTDSPVSVTSGVFKNSNNFFVNTTYTIDCTLMGYPYYAKISQTYEKYRDKDNQYNDLIELIKSSYKIAKGFKTLGASLIFDLAIELPKSILTDSYMKLMTRTENVYVGANGTVSGGSFGASSGTKIIGDKLVNVSSSGNVRQGVQVRTSASSFEDTDGVIDMSIENIEVESNSPQPSGLFAVGHPNVATLVDISVEQSLTNDITICLPVSSSLRRDVGQVSGYVVMHYTDGIWSPLDTVEEYDSDGNTVAVCADTYRFSMFAVAADLIAPGGPSGTARTTATPTQISWTPAVYISEVRPGIDGEIVVSGGDRIRLSLDAYGVQDILDNGLLDGKVDVIWAFSGDGVGRFSEAIVDADEDDIADERQVIFRAPDAPGRYTIAARLKDPYCTTSTEKNCMATFTIRVRGGADLLLTPTAVPVNPVGALPSIISDDEGNQYEVFTPVEGGEFIGDSVSVLASAGVVPNGEVIGVRAESKGDASNIGQTHQRATLAGQFYDVVAVDSEGQSLSGYLLNAPATVCLPLPKILSSNISDLAVVSVGEDGSFTMLGAKVRLSDDGVKICAGVSELSTRVAAAHVGAPSALPTATPIPPVEDPDTGGSAPLSVPALMLLLILGFAIAVLSLVLVLPAIRKERGVSP